MGRTGVLIMGFGGPYSLDEVEPFCRNLMGREPSAEVLERVRRHYLVIGGSSPLPGIAQELAKNLQEYLSKPGAEVPVTFGMRYWHPFIADGVASLVAQGVDRVVAVSLSPFESAHSSGAYREALTQAVAQHGVEVVEAASLRKSRKYVDFLGAAVNESLLEIGSGPNGVLFTAHSLPVGEIEGDPYVEELRETAAAVAALAGLGEPAADGRQSWLPGIDAFGSAGGETPWLLTFQSKGARPGEWLEPDVMDCVRAMPSAGFKGVIFSPIGFATDHMETMYDLDVEACGLALDLDMDYQRSPVPNERQEMVEALAEIVEPLL